jgi:NTE family protein
MKTAQRFSLLKRCLTAGLLLIALVFPQMLQAGDKRPVVGLVLGGGGALGYIHIGVLKVLEEYNIKVDVVSGVSAGSIVGALYALGYAPDEIEYLLGYLNFSSVIDDDEKWKHLAPRSKLHNWEPMISAAYYRGQAYRDSFSSVISGYVLNNFLDYIFWEAGQYASFNEFPIPFRCIAYDPSQHRKVVFKDGPLGRAIRASIAMPSIFAPVHMDNMVLFDGGTINNLPVDEVLDYGAEVVIAVDLSRSKDVQNSLKALELGLIVDVAFQDRMRNDEMARERANVLLRPQLPDYEAYSFGAAQILIEEGERIAREHLPELLQYAVPKEEFVRRGRHPRDAVKIDKIVVQSDVSAIPFYSEVKLKQARYITKDEAQSMAHQHGFNLFAVKMHYYYHENTLYYNVIPDVGVKLGVGISYDTDYVGRLQGGFSFKNINPFPVMIQNIVTFNEGIGADGFAYIFPAKSLFFNFLFEWSISDNLYNRLTYPDIMHLTKSPLPNIYEVLGGVGFVFGHSFYVSLGYQYQYMSMRDTAVQPDWAPDSQHATQFKQTFVYNTHNHPVYPKNGLKVYFSNILGLPPAYNLSYWQGVVGIDWAYPLTKALSLRAGMLGGMLLGDNPPYLAYFKLGGLYDKGDNYAFNGYRRQEVWGRSLWRFNLQFDYTIMMRVHAILEWNGALVNEEEAVRFSPDKFHTTAGFRIGVDFSPYILDMGLFWDFNSSIPSFILKLGAFYF